MRALLLLSISSTLCLSAAAQAVRVEGGPMAGVAITTFLFSDDHATFASGLGTESATYGLARPTVGATLNNTFWKRLAVDASIALCTTGYTFKQEQPNGTLAPLRNTEHLATHSLVGSLTVGFAARIDRVPIRVGLGVAPAYKLGGSIERMWGDIGTKERIGGRAAPLTFYPRWDFQPTLALQVMPSRRFGIRGAVRVQHYDAWPYPTTPPPPSPPGLVIEPVPTKLVAYSETYFDLTAVWLLRR